MCTGENGHRVIKWLARGYIASRDTIQTHSLASELSAFWLPL